MAHNRSEGREERYLQIRLTDDGDSWVVDLDRVGIDATDDDICGLLGTFADVLDKLHRESHVAKDLAERRN